MLSNQSLPSSPSIPEQLNLKQAFKEFALESERLEMSYRSLKERFESVQTVLQEFHTRLSGKLSELDFLSRYLESILNNISQGILFVDLNGIVTTYNTAACQLLQIPENELLFHPFTDRFKDDFFGFSVHEIFATKKCPPTTFLSLNQEGSVSVEIEVEAALVSMSSKSYSLMASHTTSSSSVTPQGVVILLRDVTKIHRLQQLTAQHDRLKELGELAAHLAHEIRNPLGGIKGFAGILQQELRERPDLQQMATYIMEGADGLNHFVSQVLHYARPYYPHLERIDLIPFMDEIRQLMQADSNWNPTIEFSIHCAVSTLVVPIDPQLFKSALLNLLVNATQAMPTGGKISVDIELGSLNVVLRIRDTGHGIAPENLSKLFSPFFTTKKTGNGLGLTEVHKVVLAHHGSIEVQSEVNAGTVFIIKIPLKIGES